MLGNSLILTQFTKIVRSEIHHIQRWDLTGRFNIPINTREFLD
jgi:hypothetical protein